MPGIASGPDTGYEKQGGVKYIVDVGAWATIRLSNGMSRGLESDETKP